MTTTNPATLPAVIRPTIIERIRAAYERHPNQTPDCITLTTTTYSRIREIAHNPAEDESRRQRAAHIMRNQEAYVRAHGHAAALDQAAADDVIMGRRIATSRIRFLDAQTPAELWRELIRDSRADRDLLTIANHAGELEQEHARLNDTIAAYDAIAARLTASEDERNQAADRAAALRKQRDSIRATEDGLHAMCRESLSDHAYIAYNAAAVYHYYGLKAASHAAGQLIRGLSHPDAMRATRTTVHPADKAPAPMRALIAAVPHDIIDRTTEQPRKLYHNAERIQYGKDGYLTHERRMTKPTPEQPAAPALYIVHHRQTVPAFIPLDSFDSPDKMDDMPRTNGGINAIIDRFDQADIIAMCSGLSATERDIVLKLMDTTAAAAGAAAVGKAWADLRARQATADLTAEQIQRQTADLTKRQDTIRYAAQWESACKRSGVLTVDAQKSVKKRIRAKLTATMTHAQAAAAVFIDTDRAAAESAQRAAKPDSTPAPMTRTRAPRDRWEILKGVQFTREGVQIPTTDSPAAVRWTRRAYPQDVQTVTKPDPITARAAAYLDTLTHCKPRTAYAAHDARRAAAVFIATMPAADIARAADIDGKYTHQTAAEHTAAFVTRAANRRAWRAEAAQTAADIATYTRRADRLTTAAESAQRAAESARAAADAFAHTDTTPAARAARAAAGNAARAAADAHARAKDAAADVRDIRKRAAIIADLLTR